MVTHQQPLVRSEVSVRHLSDNHVHDIQVLRCLECLLDVTITSALIWYLHCDCLRAAKHMRLMYMQITHYNVVMLRPGRGDTDSD